MDETGKDEPQVSGAAPQSAPSTPKATSPKKTDHIKQQEFTNPTINIIQSFSRRTSFSGASSVSREGTPPPLPPRPKNAGLLESRPSTSHSTAPTRPQLVSKATTQLSYTDTQTYAHGSRDASPSSGASRPRTYFGLNTSRNTSDVEDSVSVRSFAPTIEVGGDAESLLGEVIGDHEKSLLRSLGHRFEDKEAESMFPADPEFEAAFTREFDEVEDMKADGSNEGQDLPFVYVESGMYANTLVTIESVMLQWRAKLKHFLILSSAGKPIYSRHGDDQLITNYIGVVQTIISFYQSTNDVLRGFTVGDVRFVVISKGPLNLVAITRLPESDAQLRSQLDALYMQILSTLTLPSMERMFAARANYDLRRPLQGTETLLSALADGFTRGSPSTLLSALECLKLRKSQDKVYPKG